ncbi:MAG: substrate-binding domain-containing protein [Kiritimatiellae bacterium]|nr:substrate-binding domain-containing protein [Kiritimatiellia bacterium]
MALKAGEEPLYARVKREIKARIARGDYPARERLPSQVALCKVFEVSQITIRRAIEELVSEGILLARPGSGTYVVDSGREERRNAAQSTVAIFFRDIVGGYPLLRLLITSVREACGALGHRVQLLELPEDPAAMSATLSHVAAGVAGALLPSPVDIQVMARLREHAIPYVLLQNDLSDGFSYCVATDYASGIMDAALHLVEQGCRRLTLVTPEETRFSAGQMALGFELARRSAGGTDETFKVVQATYAEEHVFPIVKEWVQSAAVPDAVIFPSDAMANMATLVLQRYGIDVPRRTAVVGFGNVLHEEETPVPLTVVDPHSDRVGRAAMDMLQRLMRGEQPGRHRVKIRPELVVRASSRRRGG